MRMSHWMGVAFLFVLILSAGAVDWAPANASRLGQTVPTRTPTAEPPSVTPTVVVTATSTPSGAPALLPVAGNSADVGPIVVGGMGLGLMWLAWVARRRLLRSRAKEEGQ